MAIWCSIKVGMAHRNTTTNNQNTFQTSILQSWTWSSLRLLMAIGAAPTTTLMDKILSTITCKTFWETFRSIFELKTDTMNGLLYELKFWTTGTYTLIPSTTRLTIIFENLDNEHLRNRQSHSGGEGLLLFIKSLYNFRYLH